MSPQGKKRTVVIGLDGTPYHFIKKMIADGVCPHLAKLASFGSLLEMKSTHPAISSVAWTSFATGVNPAKHGIFGFMERTPNTYDIYFPNSKHVMSKTVWNILRDHNKRSVVINVPSTYPAQEMNGVLVAGFVAIDLARASYPSSIVPKLREMGYKIDVETQLLAESKDKLLDDIFLTLEKRTQAILHFLKHEAWDLFIGVFTETDRLHHFFWDAFERSTPHFGARFLDYYKKVDDSIGQIVEGLGDDVTLILLSDHGFCELKQEIYINYWLKTEGFLSFKSAPPKSLSDIAPGSKAYCLDPGRIYLNVKGREPNGCVSPGNEYEQIRNTLITKLLELKDPETKATLIDKVHKCEDIYRGKYIDRAPDLVIEPKHGYDLKGAFSRELLLSKGNFTGMHTYDDAFMYVNQKNLVKNSAEIIDVTATILASLDIPIPDDMDGVAMVKWE